MRENASSRLGSTISARGDLKRKSSISRRDFFRMSSFAAAGMGGMVILGGCSSSSGSTGSSSTTTYRIGMECAYAPYNWQTSEATDYTIPIDNVSGAYADGYDVQIAKKVCEKLNGEAVAEKMSFSGLIDALNNGQIDLIIAGMTATPERSQAIDFSDAYFTGTFGLLVKKGSTYAAATSLADFSGAAVLGQKDTLLDSIIDEIPGVNHLTPVDSVPSQISHLEQGTCDAITYNVENTDSILAANPDLASVSFAEGDGFPDEATCNVGVKKGDSDTLSAVNEALSEISASDRQSIWDQCVERQPE